MIANWKEYPLSELADIISGGTPKTSNQEYWNGDISWLSVVDFNNGNRWVFQTEKKITEKGLSESNTNLLKKGNLIISARGTVGALAQLADDMAFNQSCYGLNANSKLTTNDYLYYALRNVTDEIKRNSHGAVFDTITRETFKHIRLRIPPILEQNAISDILGCLDKKILHNHQSSQTLEAIAQTLFKSWFVDFDPVHAKAEGRQPEGMDKETAALFPDGFEESELGSIPKSWKICYVADVAEVVKGKSYSSKDLVNEAPTALVTLKSFARGGGFRLDGFKPYIGSYKSSQIVESGDLIIAYTDVTQAAELIGKPAIVVSLQEFDTLVASLDVGIIRPKAEVISRQYLYGLFKTSSFQSHTLAHTSGTTVLHLSKNAVGSFAFVCPDKKIVEVFTTIAEIIAIRNQVVINQIRTLTTLRDILLPRLISGQLSLRECQELMETIV